MEWGDCDRYACLGTSAVSPLHSQLSRVIIITLFMTHEGSSCKGRPMKRGTNFMVTGQTSQRATMVSKINKTPSKRAAEKGCEPSRPDRNLIDRN